MKSFFIAMLLTFILLVLVPLAVVGMSGHLHDTPPSADASQTSAYSNVHL